MLKDKEIIAKLNELDRAELNILARKLGIIPGESKVYAFKIITNSFYNIFPLKGKLIEHIMNKKEYKKLVEKFLKINSALKKSDADQLKQLIHKLGIKAVDSDSKSEIIRYILESAEVGNIAKRLDSNWQGIITMSLCWFFFILSLFFPEKIIFVNKIPSQKILIEKIILHIKIILEILTQNFKLFICIAGSIASIIGVPLAFYPQSIVTDYIRKYFMLTISWTLFILILVFYVYKRGIGIFSDTIGIWGSIGSIIAVTLFFASSSIIDGMKNWWKRNRNIIYFCIMLLEIIALFYINTLTKPSYYDIESLIGKWNYSSTYKNKKYDRIWNISKKEEKDDELKIVIDAEQGLKIVIDAEQGNIFEIEGQYNKKREIHFLVPIRNGSPLPCGTGNITDENNIIGKNDTGKQIDIIHPSFTLKRISDSR